MMLLKQFSRIYFIGIGGIGMSALAKYMLHLDKEVAGYDRTPSMITQSLSDEGVFIQFDDDLKLLPEEFFDKKTLVVYTPAVKRGANQILDFFIENDYQVLKRAELLGKISEQAKCLAIAGTHGKTTTAAILSHILKEAGVSATGFLGGIATNYNSNLVLGGEEFMVVEADEYDRSFLQLKPLISCITSTDADHLDIYNDKESLQETFKEFAALSAKTVFAKKGLDIPGAQTFAIEEKADFKAYDLKIDQGAQVFSVKTPDASLENIKIYLPGKHNVLNTMAALAMANSIGIPLQTIAKALLSFKGVDRRFSYRINREDFVLIDDYAHHPKEIEEIYNTLRNLYPLDKLTVVFQPHLYSRTKDFKEGFIDILSKFDHVVLLPIYPAREKPIEGVTSAMLAEQIKMKNKNVMLVKAHEIVPALHYYKAKINAMLGAGNIGEMIKDVEQDLSMSTV